jgi:hypothetical protein
VRALILLDDFDGTITATIAVQDHGSSAGPLLAPQLPALLERIKDLLVRETNDVSELWDGGDNSIN